MNNYRAAPWAKSSLTSVYGQAVKPKATDYKRLLLWHSLFSYPFNRGQSTLLRLLAKLIPSLRWLTIPRSGERSPQSSISLDVTLPFSRQVLGLQDPEPLERRFLQSLHKNPLSLIDVGAHQGLYAFDFVLMAQSRSTYAGYEPSAQNYQLLQNHLSSAGASCYCYNLACGETSGNSVLINDERGDLEGYIKSDAESLSDNDIQVNQVAESIKIVTLDEHLRETSPNIYADKTLLFIKIDVEGNEVSVLRGVLDTLRERGNWIVMFEIIPELNPLKSAKLLSLAAKIGSDRDVFLGLVSYSQSRIIPMDESLRYEKGTNWVLATGTGIDCIERFNKEVQGY